MKLQGLGVMFALIVLPLILVLTYYIQLQVDTIALQNKYDTYLLDSTHDAMSSFEINTANEDLSSVSDSLRTIIDASTNVFFSSLATNLGMSNATKSYVEPYIPGILYTLYDGYYISSPTKVPEVLTDTDGNAVTVGDVGVVKSGSDGEYSYRVIHTTEEQEKNCTVCVTGSAEHIKYVNEYDRYSKDIIESYSIKYEDLSSARQEDYGQLLYLKNESYRGNTYTADIDEARYEIDNVLKTYMPYSARYIHGDPAIQNDYTDVTIIYTLDNYITVQGTIKGKYYTKSGYLIPEFPENENDCVQYINPGDFTAYNENDAQAHIETEGATINVDGVDIEFSGNYSGHKSALNEYETKLSKAQSLKRQITQHVISDTDGQVNEFLDNSGIIFSSTTNYEKLEEAINELNKKKNDTQYELDKCSAIIYYVKAKLFSQWVYSNLNTIEEADLVEISGQKYTTIKGKEEISYDFSKKRNIIFSYDNNINKNITGSSCELAQDSLFTTHKLNVIRNSIQYNLNSAMSAYNAISSSSMLNYSMPVLSNEEWQKILTNVSIVSFMQGYKCGLKTYNNYMIVSSTNNEISFTPEDVYYIAKDEFSNEISEYHKIDCPKLLELEKSNAGRDYIAFTAKDVKYDKIYDKNNTVYMYDHKNYACYECINDGNYAAKNIFKDHDYNYDNLKKAYSIGIGKCKNNLYKMNAVEKSQGYDVIFDSKKGIYKTYVGGAVFLDSVKSIEIVLGKLVPQSVDQTILRYQVGIGRERDDLSFISEEIFTIPTNTTTNYTITVNIKPETDKTLIKPDIIHPILADEIVPPEEDPDYYINLFKNAIEYIKIIYK